MPDFQGKHNNNRAGSSGEAARAQLLWPKKISAADNGSSPARSKELQQAFEQFHQMSDQLARSYQWLEGQVLELSGELATMSEQRMEELKEKEKLADQLESLLSLMPAGVLVLDRSGVVQRANPAAETMLERRLKGRRWRSVIREVFNPQAGDGHEISLRNGRLLHISTAALDGAGQMLLLNDLTETRALQTKIARQERLTAMGKMVASLAHQIRTPLSAAILYAGNLGSAQLKEDQRNRFLDKLKARLNHLEQQVRDMLIFARGDSKIVHQCLLQELLQDLESACEPVISAAGAELAICNEAPRVRLCCNRDTLTGAIQNLVNNAVDACPEQARIEISCSRHSDEGYISVRVRDYGPGISPETAAHVMEPFFTTKSHGTGLGLAVVQAVVLAHKGTLNLNTELPQGCEFELLLPILTEREISE